MRRCVGTAALRLLGRHVGGAVIVHMDRTTTRRRAPAKRRADMGTMRRYVNRRRLLLFFLRDRLNATLALGDRVRCRVAAHAETPLLSRRLRVAGEAGHLGSGKTGVTQLRNWAALMPEKENLGSTGTPPPSFPGCDPSEGGEDVVVDDEVLVAGGEVGGRLNLIFLPFTVVRRDVVWVVFRATPNTVKHLKKDCVWDTRV